ncbi:UNVERIFIED_CONTAM: Sel1 repeat-containing protein [Hammondia hammondi]|eukprot:XP_008885070.1 Sel1 repeat-containing protein [Hammondia hammondi]
MQRRRPCADADFSHHLRPDTSFAEAAGRCPAHAEKRGDPPRVSRPSPLHILSACGDSSQVQAPPRAAEEGEGVRPLEEDQNGADGRRGGSERSDRREESERIQDSHRDEKDQVSARIEGETHTDLVPKEKGLSKFSSLSRVASVWASPPAAAGLSKTWCPDQSSLCCSSSTLSAASNQCRASSLSSSPPASSSSSSLSSSNSSSPSSSSSRSCLTTFSSVSYDDGCHRHLGRGSVRSAASFVLCSFFRPFLSSVRHRPFVRVCEDAQSPHTSPSSLSPFSLLSSSEKQMPFLSLRASLVALLLILLSSSAFPSSSSSSSSPAAPLPSSPSASPVERQTRSLRPFSPSLSLSFPLLAEAAEVGLGRESSLGDDSDEDFFEGLLGVDEEPPSAEEGDDELSELGGSSEKEDEPHPHENFETQEETRYKDAFVFAMDTMELEGRSEHVYDLLSQCSSRDVRCQYELGVFYFLGVPPLPGRNLTATLVLWHVAALGGSADAQYGLAILHSNLRDLPPLPSFPSASSSPSSSSTSTEAKQEATQQAVSSPILPAVRVNQDWTLSLEGDASGLDFSAIGLYSENLVRQHEAAEAREASLWRLPLRVLKRCLSLMLTAWDGLLGLAPRGLSDEELKSTFSVSLPQGEADSSAVHLARSQPSAPSAPADAAKGSFRFDEAAEAGSHAARNAEGEGADTEEFPVRSLPNFAANPGLPLAFLYAASTSVHPGASMALAARMRFSTATVPLRQSQACTGAANFYLPYARRVAMSYGSGIPQAPELLRFHSAPMSVNSHQSGAEEGLFRFLPSSLSAGSVDRGEGQVGARPERRTSPLARLQHYSPDLELFFELAHHGNSEMQLALGKRLLFGVDGVEQDVERAREFLSEAADAGRSEARALLGYLEALGVGREANVTAAAVSFLEAAAEDAHPIALNGLAYLHFFGSDVVDRSELTAFHLFNISASHAFPDAEANLAAMYLTGHGPPQSFVKAMQAYTRALQAGSTGAAYALGLMHLNGLGAVRDCSVAASLLKRVCEKGGFVTKHLQKAYMHYEQGRFDEAAFHLLLLAEAGHEVSQTNLAFMFDSGLTDLFFDGSLARKRLHAQRFYQLAAHQGSPLAELRLGDYMYAGYGVKKEIRARHPSRPLLDDEGNDMSEWISETYEAYTPAVPNPRLAVGHYLRVAEMSTEEKWLAPYVAKASFNLGFMRLTGIGLQQDFGVAKSHFERSLEADATAPKAPVYLALGLLLLLRFRQEMDLKKVVQELLEDPRVVLLFLIFVIAVCLLVLRLLAKRLHPTPNDLFFAYDSRHSPAPPPSSTTSSSSSSSFSSFSSSRPLDDSALSPAAASTPAEASLPSLFESRLRSSQSDLRPRRSGPDSNLSSSSSSSSPSGSASSAAPSLASVRSATSAFPLDSKGDEAFETEPQTEARVSPPAGAVSSGAPGRAPASEPNGPVSSERLLRAQLLEAAAARRGRSADVSQAQQADVSASDDL